MILLFLITAVLAILFIVAIYYNKKIEQITTIYELPEIGKKYTDAEINQYKSSHCSNCKCFNNSTDVCKNTKHWGEFCGKSISYCCMNFSYEHNIIK